MVPHFIKLSPLPLYKASSPQTSLKETSPRGGFKRGFTVHHLKSSFPFLQDFTESLALYRGVFIPCDFKWLIVYKATVSPTSFIALDQAPQGRKKVKNGVLAVAWEEGKCSRDPATLSPPQTTPWLVSLTAFFFSWPRKFFSPFSPN